MNILPRTQEHLDIIDIKDDIVILTGGRFRMVIEATAINFDLLSEDEQNATIYSYANVVNSLDYPVQVLIRTRQVDITKYINYLERHLREQPSPALRDQLQDYIDFVQDLVAENTVLQKRFFIVIPYFQSGASKGETSDGGLLGISSMFKEIAGQTGIATEVNDETLEKAKRELSQRFEELRWQFKRLGVQIKVLESEQLIRLFYEIYNPESGENHGLQEDLYGYTTWTVKSELREENT